MEVESPIVHPDYEILSSSLSAALFGGGAPPNRLTYDCVGDIITTLKDMDVLEQLCRLLSPRSRGQDKMEETDCSSEEVFMKKVSDKSTDGVPDTPKICPGNTTRDEPFSRFSEAFQDTVISKDEAHHIFNTNDDSGASSQIKTNSDLRMETWHTNEKTLEGECDLYESSCPDPGDSRDFFHSKQAVCANGLKNDQNIFPDQCDNLEHDDINYSYDFAQSFQAADYVDKEDILPCLNHNTSLAGALDEEINLCDQLPYEKLMSFRSESECSNFRNEFDGEVLNEHCISDTSLDSDHVEGGQFNCPNQDFIDTMIDTYTLSKAYCGGDNQSNLNGDDGARGDGLHFNLGLQQSWWCNEDGSSSHCRTGFAISSDPTPQDRLARITYKTQPSDAAEAPMFVFSSSAAGTDKNVSSSKVRSSCYFNSM